MLSHFFLTSEISFIFLQVQFPYCTKEEMFAMEEALNNAFNDIETDETLNDALSVYETTHKKVI